MLLAKLTTSKQMKDNRHGLVAHTNCSCKKKKNHTNENCHNQVCSCIGLPSQKTDHIFWKSIMVTFKNQSKSKLQMLLLINNT